MAIGQKVDADIKKALKARDKSTTACLRLIKAALNNKQKDLMRELNPEEEIQVLRSLAKQRGDSIARFEEGGRMDLVEGEKAELEIIEAFLPAQLDEAGINSVLDEVFGELNPGGMKDMGLVMKETMSRLGGQADGKLVNQLVRARLSG